MTRSALTFAAVLLVAATLSVPSRAQDASPDDDSCTGVIGRWQAFAAEENQGGHMDPPVFEAIQADIDRANALCQAGHDVDALRFVQGSKRRHGY